MTAPTTISDLVNSGRGMTGVCMVCGREKRFSSAAVVALPLARALTLEQAAEKLRCRDCKERQIELTAAEIDPQAPLTAPATQHTGA